MASEVPLGSVKPTAIEAAVGNAFGSSDAKVNVPLVLFGWFCCAPTVLSSTPALMICEPAFSKLYVARFTKRKWVSLRMSGNPEVPNCTPG